MDAKKNLTKIIRKPVLCSKCDGVGKRIIYSDAKSFFDDPEVIIENCRYCDETGKLIRKVTIEFESFKIPPEMAETFINKDAEKK